MPLDKSVQITQIATGDMSDIPPDAPVGAWTASCTVKCEANKKTNAPQLRFTWKLEEALTDGNEDFVGSKVSSWLTFYPARHEYAKMSKVTFKEITDAAALELPAMSDPFQWEDLADWITGLESTKVNIFTTHKPDKQTGEIRVNVGFKAPAGGAATRLSLVQDDDDEDEVAKPAKKLKKKSA